MYLFLNFNKSLKILKECNFLKYLDISENKLIKNNNKLIIQKTAANLGTKLII
jgi:hypothetical protein